MSSSNRRERELARAKRQRQISRAETRQTKSKYTFALSVASAFVLLVGFLIFRDTLFGPKDDPTQSTTPGQVSPTGDTLLASCTQPASAPATTRTWKEMPFTADKKAYAAGDPTWTLSTNCGDVVIQMYGQKAPETVRSMQFLSDNNYFDNSPCHRLTTRGLYVLQCGDPSGLGTGGPGYTIADENLPKSGANNYPAGTVAMANSGKPHSGGSQFFIVYDDTELSPNYTIFGKVIEGLDIIQKVASFGGAGGAVDGAPAQPVSIFSTSFRTFSSAKPTGTEAAKPASPSGGKDKSHSAAPTSSASATKTK